MSGYHADNVGPAIMGGFVLIRSYEPLELLRLNFPEGKELVFVLVSPDFEAPTKKMRAALPADVSMKDHVKNSSQAAALVAAVLQASERNFLFFLFVCFRKIMDIFWLAKDVFCNEFSYWG